MPENWNTVASMYSGLRAQGSGLRALGGALYLNPHELRFLGERNLHLPLRDITAVRVVRQAWWHPRRNVQVETRQGSSVYFLVNRQEEVAQRIADAVREAGGQAERD